MGEEELSYQQHRLSLFIAPPPNSFPFWEKRTGEHGCLFSIAIASLSPDKVKGLKSQSSSPRRYLDLKHLASWSSILVVIATCMYLLGRSSPGIFLLIGGERNRDPICCCFCWQIKVLKMMFRKSITWNHLLDLYCWTNITIWLAESDVFKRKR